MGFLGFAIASFFMSLFTFAVAISTSRSSSGATGFRGYTTWFRIKLWMTYALGVLMFVQGVVLLRHHRSLQSRPAVRSSGE